MPGLSFLSKKSWHTSNISNQEKVWIAEQKAESENRRTKELLDQIKAEREGEEFDKLTGRKHNNGGVSGDRGTNWMYEGGTKSAAADGNNEVQAEEEARKNEAYLLGKEYVPEGSNRNTGDFAVASAMTGALEKASTYGATIGAGYNNDGNGGAAAAAGGGGGGTTLRIQDTASDAAPLKSNSSNINDLDNTHHEWNKEFHLRHEDPMFAVHQRRMAQEKDVQKKKRLMERAGLDVQILRRGDGEGGNISTSSTTAGGLAEDGSSKRNDGNGDNSRHDDKKEDPSKDRHARRHHRNSSRRRHHHHDDRRMEKKRKRSRRSRDDERDRRRRRHHRSRSTSPSSSSSSSSYSSSSYSSDSSASSRSDSPSSHRRSRRHRSHRSSKKDDRKSTRQNHRRHRDHSDSDSPPQSDRYHDERSRRRANERVHDDRTDSRAARSSDEHRATARTACNRSNSDRRKSDEHRHHRSRDEYNNYANNSDNGGRTEAASAARTSHHDHANNNNDKNATVTENGKQGYGLVGTTLPTSSSNSQQQQHRKEPPQEGRDQHHHRRDYLGPDRQLLESKRAEMERVRQTRLNQARRR